jgi:general stress protein CsbA
MDDFRRPIAVTVLLFAAMYTYIWLKGMDSMGYIFFTMFFGPFILCGLFTYLTYKRKTGARLTLAILFGLISIWWISMVQSGSIVLG